MSVAERQKSSLISAIMGFSLSKRPQGQSLMVFSILPKSNYELEFANLTAKSRPSLLYWQDILTNQQYEENHRAADFEVFRSKV